MTEKNNVKPIDTQTLQSPPKTEAEKIWDQIKKLPINMFGLPNQIVEKYCNPAKVEPSSLYLVAKVLAVLPALETALGKKFTVELSAGYIVVRNNQ